MFLEPVHIPNLVDLALDNLLNPKHLEDLANPLDNGNGMHNHPNNKVEYLVNPRIAHSCSVLPTLYLQLPNNIP